MGICYICKSQISDTAASCPVCGAIQQAAPQPQQQAAAQPQVQPQQQAAPQPQGQYHGMQYGGTLQQSQPQQSQPQYGSAPQQSIPSQPQYGGAMQQNQPYGVSSPYNQGQPQQAPQQKQNYVQSAYSSPQQAAQGGPGGPSPEKKPVNKGLIIGLISGAAVIIAAVLLIFVFDVFGLKGGKPEAAAEAFVKAYTEMDANTLVETVAPVVKNNLS